MADRLINHPKVKILWNKVPVEAQGDHLLKTVIMKDTITGEETPLAANGLFYAIGHTPNTSVFKEHSPDLELDEAGYVKTFARNGVASTYTSIEGVFAAGDVQDKT